MEDSQGLAQVARVARPRSGIRINAICPGLVETPITQRMREQEPGFDETRANLVPMGRISAPEEIAQAVLWLSSGAASYVTGTSMLVDECWVGK